MRENLIEYCLSSFKKSNVDSVFSMKPNMKPERIKTFGMVTKFCDYFKDIESEQVIRIPISRYLMHSNSRAHHPIKDVKV